MSPYVLHPGDGINNWKLVPDGYFPLDSSAAYISREEEAIIVGTLKNEMVT